MTVAYTSEDDVQTVASIEAAYLRDAGRAHKRMVLTLFCGHYGCWKFKDGPDGYCGRHYILQARWARRGLDRVNGWIHVE